MQGWAYLAPGTAAAEAIHVVALLLPVRVAPVEGAVALGHLCAFGQVVQGPERHTRTAGGIAVGSATHACQE